MALIAFLELTPIAFTLRLSLRNLKEDRYSKRVADARKNAHGTLSAATLAFIALLALDDSKATRAANARKDAHTAYVQLAMDNQ